MPGCRSRRPRVLARVLTAAFAASLLLSGAARAADAGERLILEIGPEAELKVDSRLTRRLVALEIADVDVPAPPGATSPTPLYYRVLAESDGALKVELWELGKAQGARRVSSEGTAQLEARRIALAAGELARQLRRRRTAELAAAARPRASEPRASGTGNGFPIRGAVVFSAALREATVAGSDAFLLGPELGAALRLSGLQTVGLHAAWLAGDSSRLAGPSLRWLEAGATVTQGFTLGPRLSLHVGLEARAASVHASTTDDWSARAGLAARLAWSAAPHFTLTLGPDLGAVLHAVRDDAGGRLSGLWTGASLGIELGP